MSEVIEETKVESKSEPKTKAAARATPKPAPLAISTDPMMMIAQSLAAMQQQAGPITDGQLAILDRVMAFRDRYAAEAKKENFDEAMVKVKAELKPVRKNKHVSFEAKDKSKPNTDYWHEDLSAVCEAVDAAAPKHGISYRWDTITELNKPLVVRCIVSGFGHEFVVEQSGGRDDSGNKNHLQQQSSALTYLKRDTLKSAFGLASKDDDARTSASSDADEAISQAQLETLQQLIVQTASNIERFCKVMGVSAVADLPAKKFEHAHNLLKTKLRQQQEAGDK
jgi:hypothetical protein